MLKDRGMSRCYHNLIGITLGTGFGCGIVVNDKLLLGDNGMASSLWCTPHKYNNDEIVEEGVSIRAITNYFRQNTSDIRQLTPKDICEIADGKCEGKQDVM